MKYLIVSIHDAAPPFLDELKTLTIWLDQKSILSRSIKVIPNYLDRWNILEHSKFLDWMLSEKSKGSEIIQHGYSHKASAQKRGLSDRLRDKYITRSNAEFAKSDYDNAKERIEEGKKIMEESGFPCQGFTSPTWYQSKETVRAIQDCGFRYFTTISSIFDCRNKQNISSLAMGYLGMNAFLEYLSMVGHSMMRKTGLFCSPAARMVLHPGSVSEKGPLYRVLKEIRRLSQKRNLITYRGLLDRMNNENR